ncbi:MAG: outer membrane protein OmpA-like peptidoglycan-associated protein [Myxococcota bacterium]
MSRLSLLVAALLSGCVKVGDLADYHQEVDAGIQEAAVDQWAQECAPRELALAQSNQAFAELEFDQGSDRRAEEHLLIARTNIALALEAAERCRPKDRDGDGILDGVDECPDAAEVFNGFNDDDGCPEGDRDRDGIWDSEDQCPDEAEDLDNFMDSDGCPDRDNDNDGIPDVSDKCPDVPEDMDGDEDFDGCPDAAKDSDGDGIGDDVDKCVYDPETVNEYLDEDGCPDTPPQNVRITQDKIEIDDKILFASGKSRILPVSYGILDSVAQVMRDYPNIRVKIEGHTDSDGSESNNLRLSENRSEAVREYLTSRGGVDASRMTFEGFGETLPIDTNRTATGKANNRRVEFRITEGM